MNNWSIFFIVLGVVTVVSIIASAVVTSNVVSNQD